MRVRTLYSSAVCDSSRDMAAATWLASPQALAAVYRRLSRSRLNPAALPAMDFSGHRALLIEMGRRNTGGYQLSLAAPFIDVTGDRARVHVNWSEPRAGALLPQIITSPCLLLEIPKAPFSSVQVVDQAHRVRAAVKVGR